MLSVINPTGPVRAADVDSAATGTLAPRISLPEQPMRGVLSDAGRPPETVRAAEDATEIRAVGEQLESLRDWYESYVDSGSSFRQSFREYLRENGVPGDCDRIVAEVFGHWRRHPAPELSGDFRQAAVLEIYLWEFMLLQELVGQDNAIAFVKGMGFSKIWSPPFYATPEPRFSDSGYATQDYTAFHADLVSRFGQKTLDATLAALQRAGIGLVLDITVYHSSIAHPLAKISFNPMDPFHEYLAQRRLIPAGRFPAAVRRRLIREQVLQVFPGESRYLYFGDRRHPDAYLTEAAVMQEKCTAHPEWFSDGITKQTVWEEWERSWKGRIAASDFVDMPEILSAAGIIVRKYDDSAVWWFSPDIIDQTDLQERLRRDTALTCEQIGTVRTVWLQSGREPYYIRSADPYRFRGRVAVQELLPVSGPVLEDQEYREKLCRGKIIQESMLSDGAWVFHAAISTVEQLQAAIAAADISDGTARDLLGQYRAGVRTVQVLLRTGVVRSDEFAPHRAVIWNGALPETNGFAELVAGLSLGQTVTHGLIRLFVRYSRNRSDGEAEMDLRRFLNEIGVTDGIDGVTTEQIKREQTVLDTLERNGIITKKDTTVFWKPPVSGRGFAERIVDLSEVLADAALDRIIQTWYRSHWSTRIIFYPAIQDIWVAHPVLSALRRIAYRAVQYGGMSLPEEQSEQLTAGLRYEFNQKFRQLFPAQQSGTSVDAEREKYVQGQFAALMQPGWGTATLGDFAGDLQRPAVDPEFLRENESELAAQMQNGRIRLAEVLSANAMYRFFPYQLGWNWDNPEVFDYIATVMEYWMDHGADGFRLDAIPYSRVEDNTINENLPNVFDDIGRLHERLAARNPGVFLWGEANQPLAEQINYLKSKYPHVVIYAFLVMDAIYTQAMAVHKQQRGERLSAEEQELLREFPRQLEALRRQVQEHDMPEAVIATMLSLHDEITLEMLPKSIRAIMWENNLRQVPVPLYKMKTLPDMTVSVSTKANEQGISDTLMALCCLMVSAETDQTVWDEAVRRRARSLFKVMESLMSAIGGIKTTYYRQLTGEMPRIPFFQQAGRSAAAAELAGLGYHLQGDSLTGYELVPADGIGSGVVPPSPETAWHMAQAAAQEAVARVDTRHLLRGGFNVITLLRDMLNTDSELWNERTVNTARFAHPLISIGTNAAIEQHDPQAVVLIADRHSGDEGPAAGPVYLLMHNIGASPVEVTVPAQRVGSFAGGILMIQDVRSGVKNFSTVGADGFWHGTVPGYTAQWIAVQSLGGLVLDESVPSAPEPVPERISEEQLLDWILRGLSVPYQDYSRMLQAQLSVRRYITYFIKNAPESQRQEFINALGRAGVRWAGQDAPAEQTSVSLVVDILNVIIHRQETVSQTFETLALAQQALQAINAVSLCRRCGQWLALRTVRGADSGDESLSRLAASLAALRAQAEKFGNHGYDEAVVHRYFLSLHTYLRDEYARSADTGNGQERELLSEIFQNFFPVEWVGDVMLAAADRHFSGRDVAVTGAADGKISISSQIYIRGLEPRMVSEGPDAPAAVEFVKKRVQVELLYSIVDERGNWLKPQKRRMQLGQLHTGTYQNNYLFTGELDVSALIPGKYHYVIRVTPVDINGVAGAPVFWTLSERGDPLPDNRNSDGVFILKPSIASAVGPRSVPAGVRSVPLSI